jgi:hypothetical protein
LAAAVTRSRERTTVVSSFGADDLSPRRLTTDGGRALRDFLATAESPAPAAGSGDGDMLARTVAERLRAAGASVVVGYGSGHGRIEVAVRHPLRRGRFVLAVETDGPADALMESARQLGATRADLLVRRGWSVHRVWSAAWARDPDGENARLVDAYAKAVADADAYDWAVAAAEADVVPGRHGDQQTPDDEDGAKDGHTGRERGRVSRRKASRDKAGGAEEAAHGEGTADPRQIHDAGTAADETGTTSGDQDESTDDRGSKPVLVRRRPIGEYAGRELAALARWVESGGLDRVESDVAAEVAAELGVLHRGARTDDALIHAVRVARAGAPELS